MDFKIDKITIEDIEEIYDLGCSGEKYSVDGGKNCFWPKSTLLNLIASKNDVTLKLIVKEQIVGFCLVMIHPITKKAVIENFFILDGFKVFEIQFLQEVENHIKNNEAEFIAYMFNIEKDSNSIELFRNLDYFENKPRIWLHKNISFNNSIKK